MGTTNTLDLNNRVSALEKAAIAGLTATDVTYDNTASGLTATDVQGAVDDIILKSLATPNREFTDFDTAVDGGLYLSANYKTFNGAPQSTKSDSCVLLVLKDGPYMVQICISTYQFDKIYMRYNTTGSWSAWKSISLT